MISSLRARLPRSSLASLSRQCVQTPIQRRCYAEANDIEGMLQEKSLWETVDPSIRKLAVFAEHARAHNYQIPILSKSQHGAFDQARAYRIAAAIRQLREMNGDVVAGRKLGFTNKSIWPEYGVTESIWSYMYENTVVDLPEKGEISEGKVVLADISHLSAVEPRIEPEIVFGLKKEIDVSMSDLEIIECVEWVAHGFEIVISVFPHWRFTAADATAAFALHGLLLVGPRSWLHKQALPQEQLLENLKNFTVELYQNGEKVDSGKGTNVLGSPVSALRHLAEMLAKDEVNKPLGAGEIVTTGTLTRALPINNNDHWSTKIEGIDLPGLDVSFKVQ